MGQKTVRWWELSEILQALTLLFTLHSLSINSFVYIPAPRDGDNVCNLTESSEKMIFPNLTYRWDSAEKHEIRFDRTSNMNTVKLRSNGFEGTNHFKHVLLPKYVLADM